MSKTLAIILTTLSFAFLIAVPLKAQGAKCLKYSIINQATLQSVKIYPKISLGKFKGECLENGGSLAYENEQWHCIQEK